MSRKKVPTGLEQLVSGKFLELLIFFQAILPKKKHQFPSEMWELAESPAAWLNSRYGSLAPGYRRLFQFTYVGSSHILTHRSITFDAAGFAHQEPVPMQNCLATEGDRPVGQPGILCYFLDRAVPQSYGRCSLLPLLPFWNPPPRNETLKAAKSLHPRAQCCPSQRETSDSAMARRDSQPKSPFRNHGQNLARKHLLIKACLHINRDTKTQAPETTPPPTWPCLICLLSSAV